MTDKLNLRILIADDHFLIRQFVRRSLMDAGLSHIDMVSDGNEAVDVLNKSLTAATLYDIVFLDWNMPQLPGIEVLSFIRNKPQYHNSAVVMFTAESEKASIVKAIKMGATAYILKPISPGDLSKKIIEVLEWIAARRAGKA